MRGDACVDDVAWHSPGKIFQALEIDPRIAALDAAA